MVEGTGLKPVDDISGFSDQGRAARLEQSKRSSRVRGIHPTWQAEHLPAVFLAGQSRSDECTRAVASLDDQHAETQSGDNSVPGREVFRGRGRAEREFTDERPALGDARKKSRILGRIGRLQPAPEDRESPAPVAKRSVVRGSVNAPGPAGNDRETGCRQEPAESARLLLAILGTLARSDDGDRKAIRWVERSPDIQQRWAVGQLSEKGRIPRFTERNNCDAEASGQFDFLSRSTFGFARTLQDSPGLGVPDSLDDLDFRGARSKDSVGRPKAGEKPRDENGADAIDEGQAEEVKGSGIDGAQGVSFRGDVGGVGPTLAAAAYGVEDVVSAYLTTRA